MFRDIEESTVEIGDRWRVGGWDSGGEQLGILGDVVALNKFGVSGESETAFCDLVTLATPDGELTTIAGVLWLVGHRL